MKIKNLYVFALAAFICAGIFSCTEYLPVFNDDELSEVAFVPVSFKVDFSKEIIGFRSDEAVELREFFYHVYITEDGSLYKKMRLTDFTGVINDSLPEGDYTIVFAGCNMFGYLYAGHGDNIKTISHPSMDYPSFEFMGPPTVGLDPNLTLFNRNRDVFYKKINCIVEIDKSNDNSVSLDRIVGKIEIVLEDIIPSEVETITIGISNFSDRYFYTLNGDFTKATGYGSKLNISESDKVAAGFSRYITIFENVNSDQSRYPVSITLTARRSIPEGVVDTGQSVVASKTIDNVDVLKNKTVRYTGKLFDNITPPTPEDPESSFTISIDDEWGETIEKEF